MGLDWKKGLQWGLAHQAGGRLAAWRVGPSRSGIQSQRYGGEKPGKPGWRNRRVCKAIGEDPVQRGMPEAMMRVRPSRRACLILWHGTGPTEAAVRNGPLLILTARPYQNGTTRAISGRGAPPKSTSRRSRQNPLRPPIPASAQRGTPNAMTCADHRPGNPSLSSKHCPKPR